jgi:hypothetical protein
VADTWSETPLASAPTGRYNHTAVWTGTAMVVWGGYAGTYAASGGRYTPSSNTWSAATTSGAPAGRIQHSAVWTGARMIVWGGQDLDGVFDSGGRYDPVGNAWQPTSMTMTPAGRSLHRAVWTGSFMVTWGGQDATGPLSSGGRYALGQSSDDDLDGYSECDGDCDDTTAAIHPGASQICDGLNNDCGDPAWPSTAGTNERDDDGDSLSECQGDCADTVGSAWATPGEVADLMLVHTGGAGGTTDLSWTLPAPGGAAAGTRYDVLRTSTASDFVTSAGCLAADAGPAMSAADTTDPPLGGVFFYLVRAENGCPSGIGSLGVNSQGVPRSGRPCP